MAEGYYKINPEIKDFILKEADEKPQLGCRKLSSLIQDKFGLEISKSSISAILKAKGLSKPVGRRGRSPRVGSVREPSIGTVHEPSVGAVRERPLLQVPDNGLSLLTAEEKPLLTKIERDVSLAPRIIQNDKLPPVVQDGSRQIQVVSPIQKSPPKTIPGLGCWFLKAAELCLGGLHAFSALLSSNLKEPAGELLAKNEALLYLSVLGEDMDMTNALEAIVGRRYSTQDIKAYFESLNQVEQVNLRLFIQEALSEKEVISVKFVLADGGYFFLDGSTRSIWAKNHMPPEFSQGLSRVRDYLANIMLQGDFPLIGQALPGFAAPPPVFLNFIAAFSGKNPAQAIKKVELYDNENKLIEPIEPVPSKRHYFVFGAWPWQYPDRSLFQKEGLRLIAYKRGNKKILDVITNLPEDGWDDQRVISLYLERWPNLEAGNQDFLDRIGHYFEIRKAFLPPENVQIEMPQSDNLDPNQILDFWKMKLSSFCQNHFFPLKYNKANFSLLRERFYSLPGIVNSGGKSMEIVFSLAQGFIHSDDLSYACQRVNESDIRLEDGRQLRFILN